jgi:protein TonB
VIFVAVGLFGMAFPYPKPAPPPPVEKPIVAQKIEVQLTEDISEPDPAPPATQVLAPTPPETIAQPQLPTPIPVAEPSPAIAFALPVEGPTRVVEAAAAAFAAPVITNTAPATTQSSPPVQRLTFGQGEGRQPAPDYPVSAMQAGQEGTVTVRFVVQENGRVLSAEASQPCRWPLLNSAAVGAVQRRWRFRPGAIRLYEVPIRFQLEK